MVNDELKELEEFAEPHGFDVALIEFIGTEGSFFSVFPTGWPDDGNPFATADEARAYIEGAIASRGNRAEN